MTDFLKKNLVEIIIIVLAIIVLGIVWNNEKNKPEPVVPTINPSQIEESQ